MSSKSRITVILRSFVPFSAILMFLTSFVSAQESAVGGSTAYTMLETVSGAVWIHRLILLSGLFFVSPIVYFLWKSMKAFSLESIMGGSLRYVYAGSLILSFMVVNRAISVEFGFNILEIALGSSAAVILTDLLLVTAVFLYAYGFKIITTMYDEERE